MADAQDLLDAARGDKSAVMRLPGPLRTFVAIHLDDEQRKFLATKSVADLLPELARFLEIGEREKCAK